jgi:hypothetical protein
MTTKLPKNYLYGQQITITVANENFILAGALLGSSIVIPTGLVSKILNAAENLKGLTIIKIKAKQRLAQ